jgi:cytoskeletal protein RodZ
METMTNKSYNNNDDQEHSKVEAGEASPTTAPTNELKDFLTVGQTLKSLRERKGIALSSISQRTKVNMTILRALEEDDLASLPDKTYVRGFIKAYVREINANLEEILLALDETYEAQGYASSEQEQNFEEEGTATFTQEKLTTDPSFSIIGLLQSIPIKFYKKGILALISVSILIFLVNKLSESSKKIMEVKQNEEVVTKKTAETAQETSENEPISSEVPNDKAKALKLAQEKEAIALKKEEEAKAKALKLTQEKEATALKKAEETKALKLAQEKETQSATELKLRLQQIAQKEVNIANEQKENREKRESRLASLPVLTKEHQFTKLALPLFELDSTSADNTNEEIIPLKYRQAVIPGLQNVFISAFKGSSWITYKNGDGPIKTFTLKEGRTLLIRGREIRIFLGNVNVTKIFLNNTLLKINAPNGVKSLVFPESLAEKYVTPLFVRDVKGNSYTSAEYLELVKNSTAEDFVRKYIFSLVVFFPMLITIGW